MDVTFFIILASILRVRDAAMTLQRTAVATAFLSLLVAFSPCVITVPLGSPTGVGAVALNNNSMISAVSEPVTTEAPGSTSGTGHSALTGASTPPSSSSVSNSAAADGTTAENFTTTGNISSTVSSSPFSTSSPPFVPASPTSAATDSGLSNEAELAIIVIVVVLGSLAVIAFVACVSKRLVRLPKLQREISPPLPHNMSSQSLDSRVAKRVTIQDDRSVKAESIFMSELN